jgi:hypothetical protein
MELSGQHPAIAALPMGNWIGGWVGPGARLDIVEYVKHKAIHKERRTYTDQWLRDRINNGRF